MRLFHAAVLQSGGFAQWASQPMNIAQDQYTRLMHGLKCDIHDVDCLVNQSAETLQAAFTATNDHNVPTCRDACEIAPAVDDKVLRSMTATMF